MAANGPAKFYNQPWSSLGAEIVHPIGCADCHDAKTMNLAVSRPALKEAFERTGRDISKATQQELRSLVCAQCHEEYYFRPADMMMGGGMPYQACGQVSHVPLRQGPER